MDLATILGIIVGVIFMVMGITLDGSLLSFYNLPSIVIVIGGTIAGTFVAYPFKKIADSFQAVKKAFSFKKLLPGDTIHSIIELSNVARREGLLALEEASEKIEDEFLRKGVMLIVDGTDPELVRNILETELTFLEERHLDGKSVFDTMGSLAPAFGMIGTLIGLINMLQKLDDPKSIGPSMGVALITTFYGSVLANLVFIPIASKLRIRSKEEILIREIMVEGLLSIQAGENPRIIEEKLKAFLPPQLRKLLKNNNEEGVEA
jgi:chemotaxis protein MotA